MKIGQIYIQFYDVNSQYAGKERVIFEYLKNNTILIKSNIQNGFNSFPIEQNRIVHFNILCQISCIKKLKKSEIVKYKLLGYIS